MSDNSSDLKNDLINIIEDIDLANSTLNEARKVALGRLKQAEQKGGT